MRNLRVNGARLWASLMSLAEIGATLKAACAGELDGEARGREPRR